MNTKIPKGSVFERTPVQVNIAGTGWSLGSLSAGGCTTGLAFDFAAQILPNVVWHLEEDFDNFRIELASRPAQDFRFRRLERLGRTIRAIRGDGIQRVGNRKDARPEGDFPALQAAGIAGAVEALLV